MTTDTPGLVERLKGLLEKGTPGPWTACDHKGWAQPYISVATDYGGEYGRDIMFPGKATKESGGKIIGETWATRGKIEIELANAELIALTPALAQTVIDQADRIAALEKELAEAKDRADEFMEYRERENRTRLAAETSRDNALRVLVEVHDRAMAVCNDHHANADDSLVRQKYALALHDIATLTKSAKDTNG